jgi:hypothetical protein
MNPESKIQREILVAANQGDSRLFRNNIAKMKHHGRWLSFGIPGKGGSDLLGWTSKTITSEMVGQKIAIFTSIEVKTPTGKPTKEQTRWLNLVNEVGGIGRIIRDAKEL